MRGCVVVVVLRWNPREVLKIYNRMPLLLLLLFMEWCSYMNWRACFRSMFWFRSRSRLVEKWKWTWREKFSETLDDSSYLFIIICVLCFLFLLFDAGFFFGFINCMRVKSKMKRKREIWTRLTGLESWLS